MTLSGLCIDGHDFPLKGGQACMFGYNMEKMSNFALDTDETCERQFRRTLDHGFYMNI